MSSCEKAKHQLADAIENNLIKDKAPATPGDAPEAPAAVGPLVRSLSAEEYPAFIATPGHLVVVDFYADWCGPCRQLAPILEAVVEEQGGKVLLGKVNVDDNEALAAKMGISGIPDVRFFRDGKQVDSFKGAPPETFVRERLAALVGGTAVAVAPKPEPPKPEPPKPQPLKPGDATAATKPGDPKPGDAKPGEEPKQTIAPMSKDWLPPGVERR